MNEAHLQFLASPDWARTIETELLPWVLGVADLGDDVLEIGPGPGLTTDALRQHVARLTAVELDDGLAGALSDRLAGSNVAVLHVDATESGLASDRFSAVTCFAMLHHMPSPALQDRLFAEVHRMLLAGGAFIGTDSIDSEPIRAGHADDIFVPVDPGTLPSRLQGVGFTDVSVDPGEYQFRFHARKPPGP